jgi:hypothetical protein
MPTIATVVDQEGSRKVVTKLVGEDRRVSCSCCESGQQCCVYPASCGVGPEAVEFYGDTLSGSGTSFGDTENGVILESGVWAVYRNGVRTERDCLGLATGAGTINVAASLATSYAMAFDWIYDPISDPPGVLEITATLSYINTAGNEGVIGSVVSEGIIDGAVGQCGWSGSKDQVTQAFDEGFALFFNTQNCRWEITAGPINALYGYRSSDMPTGVYISNFVDMENITIS